MDIPILQPPVLIVIPEGIRNDEKMRYLVLFSLVLIYFQGFCQQSRLDGIEGFVSYKTSQNIYVKFPSTRTIEVGDTLYISGGDTMIAAMQVTHISSLSCVGTPMDHVALEKGQVVFIPVKKDEKKVEKPDTDMINENETVLVDSLTEKPDFQPRITANEADLERINGRLSVYSYSNLSNIESRNSQRMRYTFSMNAQHINNSRISLETYISFRHKIGEWSRVQENINDALKIYNLAATYHLSENSEVSIGRKTSRYITNIGAIDGLQFTTRSGSFLAGIIIGSRPDYRDYSFNFNYRQYGAYLGHEIESKNGSMSNTFAFVEQQNHGQVDRRYAYYQHVNTLLKNLSLFYSFEVDLYQKVEDQISHQFQLSSAFVSLRWRASRKLTLSGSYDARKNIIYYESYKNFIDRLIEEETRQGLRLSLNIRPVKGISIGVNGGSRFQKDQHNESKNLYTYLNFSRVPWLKMSTTINVTFLESAYLRSKIYGVRGYKDLIPGKLYSEFSYRHVNYNYLNAEIPIEQDIVGAGISWRIAKKISFSVNYEGTFEKINNYHRIFAQITKRIY